MVNEEAELNEGSLEEMKRRTLDVIKEKKLRLWVQVVNSKKEKEEEEEEEREENLNRQWDGLPSLALLNIFCNTELKDRLASIPLVCKSWKNVTDDPRCWSSMIPHYVSPEDAFIKKRSGYSFPHYFFQFEEKEEDFLVGISCLFKEEGQEQEEEEVVPVGLKRLRTLIKKSGGGAAIKTLYLGPFSRYGHHWRGFDETYDEILHLIASCCPNLKHISFEVQHHISMEVVLLLLSKCKKLELIHLIYFGDEEPKYSKLLESLSCLPDLYGFHICTYHPFLQVSTPIATHLPQLKLLHMDGRPLEDKHLSVILSSCLELQYLSVLVDRELCHNQDIIDQASAQILEFHYERHYRFDTPSDHDNYSVSDEYLQNVIEDHVSKKIDHASRMVNDDICIKDDFRIDDYRDILKQRKEDQYVSILKEKMNRKKKKYQCNYSLKKKKKKNSTMKKNKKDQCVYADYVIQSK